MNVKRSETFWAPASVDGSLTVNIHAVSLFLGGGNVGVPKKSKTRFVELIGQAAQGRAVIALPGRI
jgi:hypothetical protein